MNAFQTFEEVIASSTVHIPALSSVISLLVAGAFSVLLGKIYVRFGNSLSNRLMLANSFIPICMTTMLIISIVKSSLALSLGLVGALSIVRFRAAIKEPEELTYIFIAIAIGLGFGADQGMITTVAFLIIMSFIIFRKKIKTSHAGSPNLYLTISSKVPDKLSVNVIRDALMKWCTDIELRRFDEEANSIEVSFLIEVKNYDDLNKAKESLQQIDREMKISILDDRGIV